MVVLSALQFQNKGYHLKDEINRISSESFGHSTISPNVETAIQENAFIGFIEMDGHIVTSGFGKEDTYNTNNKTKTMLLHTFSTDSEYRGQGLCKKTVNEFVKKFGKTHVLYLTVRTEEGNVNESAIKCYENNGFVILPSVYRDHYDGKNSAMVRLPPSKHPPKKSKKSRGRRRTRR
jgi:ribosomal protein S18 acetylase RimI-like enzyme